MALNKASLLPLLLLSTLFLASSCFAVDREMEKCMQQYTGQDVQCQMGCLKQKEQGGGSVGGEMQPLIPREAYEKYCQDQCQVKEREPKAQQQYRRSCMERFKQQQQRQPRGGGGEQGGGGEETNDDEGELWEEMREDMCEKSCLLQLGEGMMDQPQLELCERSCQRKLTLQFKQCRQSCQMQAKAATGKAIKKLIKPCQTQCREQIEQEQQEQLEQQEQEQQAQQEQEQQAQQEQEQQAQQEQEQQAQQEQQGQQAGQEEQQGQEGQQGQEEQQPSLLRTYY